MGYSSSRQAFTYSIPCSEARPNETPIFRHPESLESLEWTASGNETTVYEMFQTSVDQFSNLQFLGTRTVLEEGYGEYVFKTYGQIHQTSDYLASGLVTMGLVKRRSDIPTCFGIFSKNREEWIIFDITCAKQSLTVVALYDVLKDNTIRYIIEQTEMRILALSNNNIDRLLEMKGQGLLPQLETIIPFEEVEEDLVKQAHEIGLQVITMDELAKAGKESPQPHSPPSPEDVHTICYTSGTTGMPKGAILTHHNMVATITGIMKSGIEILSTDIHISYLPLAHMMERIIYSFVMQAGGSIGFYCGQITQISEDLQALRPTIFISVPRLFNKFYNMINQRFLEQRGIRRMLVDRAVSIKLHNLLTTGYLHHSFYDRVVFRRIRNSLGGRIRYMLTGAAPISGEVLNFLRIAFSCPLVEGYGQTESCAGSVHTELHDMGAGYVGGPIRTIEMKLISVPEMRYTTDDIDERGRPYPKGEICFRGPTIFRGYFKLEEETAEALDEEGWLHTGDIGAVLPENGALKLIDRKKNIFKLSQGEYVAVEKVESAYYSSPFVHQIFVYGEPIKPHLVAIVVVNPEYLRKNWASIYQLENQPIEALQRDPRLRRDVLRDLEKVGREAGLLGYEIVQNVYIEIEPWTELNLLTYTHKLKRFDAREAYRNVLESLYENMISQQQLKL